MIIGTIKGGTTSLHHYLDQHPDVYMSPKKEPTFFAVDYDIPLDKGLNRWAVTDIEGYRALFAGVTTEKAVGESSPQYLWSPLAPRRIREIVPNVKLVAILRNPVERCFSSFQHLRREGGEQVQDFREALRLEKERIESNLGPLWRYKEVGFYSGQLERYFEQFDRRQMMICLYEDLCSDPIGLVQDMYRFIGVNDQIRPDVSERYNISKVPRNRRLDGWVRGHSPTVSALASLMPERPKSWLAHRMRRWNSVKLRISMDVQADLVELYRADILKTQELIGRDLSAWLEKE